MSSPEIGRLIKEPVSTICVWGIFNSRESLQNDQLTLNFTCHFKVAINQQQSIFFNTSLKRKELIFLLFVLGTLCPLFCSHAIQI